MRRFPKVPAPHDWDTRGLQPGIRWLRDHPRAERPRDLWSPFRNELAAGFSGLCGYTLTYVPNGTVDHFTPWTILKGTTDEWRAYDWHNFRHCDGWFNSARRGPVPDPFLVEDSWFELRLPSLELFATDAVPASERAAVDNVLRWLRDDPRVMGPRQEWLRMYREGELNLDGLARKAPLIAAALRRQPEFLLAADRGLPRAATT